MISTDSKSLALHMLFYSIKGLTNAANLCRLKSNTCTTSLQERYGYHYWLDGVTELLCYKMNPNMLFAYVNNLFHQSAWLKIGNDWYKNQHLFSRLKQYRYFLLNDAAVNGASFTKPKL